MRANFQKGVKMKICKFEEAIARLGKHYEFKKEYEMFEYEILMIKQKIRINFGLVKAKRKCEIVKIRAVKK